MATLPYNSVVNVSITTTPQAVQRTGFGVLNIVTKEIGGITRAERYRLYPSIEAVSVDFPSSTEAYKSASTYFSQSPRPKMVMISNRFEDAQPALLTGGTVEATLGAFKAISDGGFDLRVGGDVKDVTGLDFSAATDFTGVASVISAGLSPKATCAWKDTKFEITSASSGVSSTLTYLSEGSTGTNISSLMQCAGAEEDALLAQGVDAETVTQSLDAIQERAGSAFYGFSFTKEVRDKVVINGESSVIAAAIWAEARVKVFFNTTNDLDTLNPAVETDTASLLEKQGFNRSLSTYSSYKTQYPEASVAGRAFTVDFNVPNSVITLMFKKLPTISSEGFGSQQQLALDAKNCNYYTSVGSFDMFQKAKMASGKFFDTVHGVDWLTDAIQIEEFNTLATNKVIQFTDAGTNRLEATLRKVLDQAVLSGLAASGYYTNPTTGEEEFLPLGYKINRVAVKDIPAGDKSARQYNGLSFYLIGAGAIHGVDINGTFDA